MDSARKTVVIALSNRDFDPTEVVVPWRVFMNAGYTVEFVTGDGKVASCDPRMLVGVLFGKLGATAENVALYRLLEFDPGFLNPGKYESIDADRHCALILPGGHAKQCRQYLESEALQERALEFMRRGLPVGAICHGGVVLARTQDPATGASVLEGRTMTALTRRLEMSAWLLTAWKLGDYYRTYPTWVQDEVQQAMGLQGNFKTGPFFPSYGNPLVVRDENLITARWPGDAQAWAEEILRYVESLPNLA